MPRLRLLTSAQTDLVDIFEYITEQSGNRKSARRFVKRLRQRCVALAKQPATLGTARPELQPGIRSFAVGRYVILFRYVGDVFEVVTITEGHRDLTKLFGTVD